nr:immunoglobulin light chain junction region [Macaca mulatta]
VYYCGSYRSGSTCLF